MARDGFEIDMTRFRRFLRTSSDAVFEGAQAGMEDALDLWQVSATNLAPIGRYPGRRGGNLRARIDHTEVTRSAEGLSGNIVANAFNGYFNYGYYLHETAPSKGRTARTPGTSLEFSDDALKDKEPDMQRLIESSIEAELRRRGLM